MNDSSSLEKTSGDLPEEALGIAEIANAATVSRRSSMEYRKPDKS